MATKAMWNEKGDTAEESQTRNWSFLVVCQIFGIKSIKHYQKKSMVALSKGEDWFLC